MEKTKPPALDWDCGTAYDLFASLYVLHQPERFGLRSPWAAGVRSRLPAAERKFLEEIKEMLPIPVSWVYRLPAPKDAAVALWMLGQAPPEARLALMEIDADSPPEVVETLQEVSSRGAWAQRELEILRNAFQHKESTLSAAMRTRVLTCILDWWSRPAEFGERFLSALRVYYSAFFEEEELRISPVLQAAVAAAQEKAGRYSLPDLLEELSQGLQIPALYQALALVLVPSYWLTPLIVYRRLASGSILLLYGGRPKDAALVPGEVVPDAMLRALKALADPTRLRVLRYLSRQPLTLSQLSRRLRLRAPTMVHHLNALRLAGLVSVTLESESDKRYAVRGEALRDTFSALGRFMETGDED